MDGNFGCTLFFLCFFIFLIWLEAIALTGPGVENSSTVRGDVNFITCLVDHTKLLNNTRYHIPKSGTVPIRYNNWCWRHWQCWYFLSIWADVLKWNQVFQRLLPAKRYKTKGETCRLIWTAQPEIFCWRVYFFFFFCVSYRPGMPAHFIQCCGHFWGFVDLRKENKSV